MNRHSAPPSLMKNLKIVGYCGLAAVALALFVAMCAILKDNALDHPALHAQPGENIELHSGTDADVDGSPSTVGQTRTPS